MAAASAWYYRARDGVVGPVSAAALKRLVDHGTIGPATPIRRGEDGPWFSAERIYDALVPVAELEPIGDLDGVASAPDEPFVGSGGEPAEWYFSREDRRKLGPVPRSVMIAMTSQGKLGPTDLVWRPGMASWVPAADLPELREVYRAGTAPVAPPMKDTFGRRAPSSARLAGVAVAIALITLLTTAVWMWMKSGRRDIPVDRPANLASVPAILDPAAGSGLMKVRPYNGIVADDPKHLVDDALAAVRGGDLNRAGLLLNQYLSRPGPLPQSHAARTLLREVELAASTVEADTIARRLSDEQIEDHLATGGQSLVGTSVQTPELRPLYARTLLQALQRESNRRQSLPNKGVTLAQIPQDNGHPAPAVVPEAAPDDDEADRAPSTSILGSDDAIAPNPGNGPDRHDNARPADRRNRKDATTIETILDSPKSFENRTFTLDGLYKVGTLLTRLKGRDGNAIGWSLPVGGDDDRLICTGDEKVVGRDRYLILDSALAPLLLRVFDQLKFRPAARPTYKCTLTITVRSLIVNNVRVPVVTIVGLEILGICDFIQVAQRRYEKAFWTVRVSPEKAFVTYGDGASWVERLGGEERFVKPLRRKLRDLRRRVIAERGHAIVGSVLQAELGRVVNMAAVAQQQQSRFAAALIGNR